jgi:hypothetical protein
MVEVCNILMILSTILILLMAYVGGGILVVMLAFLGCAIMFGMWSVFTLIYDECRKTNVILENIAKNVYKGKD